MSSVLDDGDRLARAAADSLLDDVAQRLAGVLDEDVRLVVVTDHEHLGRHPFADRIALAEIRVHPYAHRAS